MQSPSVEDDEVFAGNVSIDEGILDADDDVKVGGHDPSKVSVPKVILSYYSVLKVTVEKTLGSMGAIDGSDTETITLVRNKSSGAIYLMVRFSVCFSLIYCISGAR